MIAVRILWFILIQAPPTEHEKSTPNWLKLLVKLFLDCCYEYFEQYSELIYYLCLLDEYNSIRPLYYFLYSRSTFRHELILNERVCATYANFMPYNLRLWSELVHIESA